MIHNHLFWFNCKHSLLNGFGSCQVALSRQYPGTAQETPDAKDCFQATIWTWTSCFEHKGSKLEHMDVIHCHATWTQIPGQINSVTQKLLSSPAPKGWALQIRDWECPLQWHWKIVPYWRMQHSNIWDVFGCLWIAQLSQQLQIKSRNRLGSSASDHLERFVWWELLYSMLSVLDDEVKQKGLLEQYYRWLLFCLFCSQILSLSASFLQAFALLSCRSRVSLWTSFTCDFWDFPAWPEQACHLDSSVWENKRAAGWETLQSLSCIKRAQTHHSQAPNPQAQAEWVTSVQLARKNKSISCIQGDAHFGRNLKNTLSLTKRCHIHKVVTFPRPACQSRVCPCFLLGWVTIQSSLLQFHRQHCQL